MTDTYRVRRVDREVDLVAEAGESGWLFVRDGVGCAGRGEHIRTSPDRVLGELQSLRPAGDNPPGAPGPVAIGARPFRPDLPWTLVIPSFQMHVDAAGGAWQFTLDGHCEPPLEVATTAPQAPRASEVAVRVDNVDDPDTWCAAVHQATTAIATGRLEKVVLAREVTATSQVPLSFEHLAERLRSKNPGCYVFNVDGLLGASPELLVERDGDLVRAQPMAGTTRRSAHAAVDDRLVAELFASATYRHEHQVTIDMVHDTLLPFASYLDFQPEPSVVRLATVSHLASWVEGRLSQPPASVMELVDALHPTPAVSGRPRAEALALISELEPGNRDRYAGTVGWVDAEGNGTWAVTIRCAQIDPDDRCVARVHAGCGIVADSDPHTELAESEAKLQAALSALLD